mgnify:CR=1 FL=1
MENRSEQTLGKGFADIGREILFAARNELYLNLPYLDVALCALAFQPGGEVTLSLATDGETLYYDGSWLSDRYLRSQVLTNRAYLHVILHCMLRHLGKKQGKAPELWDLACDAAVESILDELNYPCLNEGTVPMKQKFWGECRREMKVLTAEGIYRHLLRRNLPPYELAQLQRVFLVDDHGLWAPEDEQDQKQQSRQDQKWQDLSEKTQTGLETVMSQQGAGGETVLEQVRVANREDVDYRVFLRRFAVPREVMAVDGDAFDYIFYTYGLQLYGNMPLVEPPETKEEKRIEDFVIAVDTSMSTSGELVKAFLKETFGLLKTGESFFAKCNIAVMQCDDAVRDLTFLHSTDELDRFAACLTLTGGGGTDFRPAFAKIEELRRDGTLRDLQGVLYFTDGKGTYPTRRPPYETAFLFLETGTPPPDTPPWAMRLVLSPEEFLPDPVPKTPEIDWQENEAEDLPEL